jgi:imidazoleglycerol phosphate synthase glutamine amidotransferase subunit HisH
MSKTTKPKTTKKTTTRINSDEILQAITTNLEHLAEADAILIPAVGSLAEGLARAEEKIAHWRNTTICAVVVSGIAIAVCLIK